MGLVAKVAPGIATLIQEGPGGLIKNAIEPAISSWVGSITGGVNVGQIAGQLKGTFSAAFAVLQGAKAGDPKCCDTLVSGINAIREVAQAFVHNPVFQAIKGIFEKVSGIVETVTKLVIGPVFDVLKTIVGGAGTRSRPSHRPSASGSSPSRTSPARRSTGSSKARSRAARARADCSTGSSRRPLEIRENIKKTLQPVIGPLKVVAGVLLPFTPLPEIYAIIKYGPQIVEAGPMAVGQPQQPRGGQEEPRSARRIDPAQDLAARRASSAWSRRAWRGWSTRPPGSPPCAPAARCDHGNPAAQHGARVRPDHRRRRQGHAGVGGRCVHQRRELDRGHVP